MSTRHLSFVVLTLALAGLAMACGSSRSPGTGTAEAPVDLVVQRAVVETIAEPFEVGGVVRARTTATLMSRIVAPVESVRAQPGDRVRAGQILVTLDDRELQANRARAEAAAAAADQGVRAAVTSRLGAEASLALVQATHRRVSDLRARNSATPNELDQAVGALRAAEAAAQGAQAGVRQAEAAAEAAHAGLRAAAIGASYTVICAPFDGTVTQKLLEPGNTAAPGVPLMTVEDSRTFRLEVQIDEARVETIDRTRPVAVVLDALSGPGGDEAWTRPLEGKVAEFARTLDPGSHAFLLKIDLPPTPALRSGMFGRARLLGPSRPGLLVPATAVVRHGQITSVYVAGADGLARRRLVQIGTSFQGHVEVLAGLDQGEVVAVAPPLTLADGAPVRVVPGTPPAPVPSPRPEVRQ